MKYWRKTTKWPFIAQRQKGARLSLPKYGNDRLELLSDYFQALENRQEFGHITNKTGDHIWNPPPMFCECLFEPDGWILLPLARWGLKQARSINRKKKRVSGFYFKLCCVLGHPKDSNSSYDSFIWRIWEFHMNNPRYIFHKHYYNIHVDSN